MGREKSAMSLCAAVLLAVACPNPGAAGGVKLPAGTKLPPQPKEWMAPRTILVPPPAEALWTESWLPGRPLPKPLAGHCMLVRGTDLYVIGGVTGREALGIRDTWRSRVGRDGKLGAWRRLRALPRPVTFGAAVLSGERIYWIGGSNREAAHFLYDTIYSAPLRRNGSIGKWRTERPLPEPLRHHAAAVCGGYLYVLGGFNGSEYRDVIRYSRIGGDGALGEWREAAARYPHPIGRTVMLEANGALLVVGGLWSDSQGEHVSSLMRRGVPGDGGDIKEWKDEGGLKVSSRPLRFSLAEHAGAWDGNFLCIFGGRDPDALGVPTVQASWYDPRRASLTRWQTGPQLPLFGAKGAPQDARLYQSAAAIVSGQAIVAGGFLYVRQPTDLVWRMPLAEYREPDWLAGGD